MEKNWEESGTVAIGIYCIKKHILNKKKVKMSKLG